MLHQVLHQDPLLHLTPMLNLASCMCGDLCPTCPSVGCCSFAETSALPMQCLIPSWAWNSSMHPAYMSLQTLAYKIHKVPCLLGMRHELAKGLLT